MNKLEFLKYKKKIYICKIIKEDFKKTKHKRDI